MKPENQTQIKEVVDEPPPFLGSWPRVYVAVLVYLFTLIGVFYAFTVALRP